MKTLIALVGLLLASSTLPAHAGSMGVINTAGRGTALTGIDISSAPAVSVVGGLEQGIKNVCIQNLDSTFSIVCGDTVNVSSITTSSLIGTIIPPAVSTISVSAPTCFPIVENGDFFCRTTKLSGSTRAGRNLIK